MEVTLSLNYDCSLRLPTQFIEPNSTSMLNLNDHNLVTGNDKKCLENPPI
jgi:hypothetical protein